MTIGCALTNISTKTSTCVIEWIDEAERGGSSGTTRGKIADKVAPELCLLVNTAQEDLFVHVLEGEVERLCGEVTDDVGQVASPESAEALLLGDTDEAVDDAWKIDEKFGISVKIIFFEVMSLFSL